MADANTAPPAASGTPSITAVLPNYNHAQFLPEILSYVLGQYTPFDQIIIIDDASTDGSQAILQDYAARHPELELILLEQNGGVVNALNKGYAKARGDFLFPLSSDDKFNAHIVTQAREVLAAFPDAHMLAANTTTIAPDNAPIGQHQLPFKAGTLIGAATLEAVAKERVFTFFGGGCMMRRTSVLALDIHRSDFAWYADWALYMLLALHHPVAITPHLWAWVRDGEERYSAQMKDWSKQRPALDNLLSHIKQQHPDSYSALKRMAMLPDYRFRILLWLCLGRHRDFLSGLLIWRLVVFSSARTLKQWVPRRAVRHLRKWLRL